MQIGAQFFTVREFTKTLEDLSLTLRKVADIGYKTVQLSATCPFEPEWMKEQLAANGLKCVVTHVRDSRLVEDTAAVAAEHEIFGCQNVGLGQYKFRPEEGETVDKFVETYGPVAKTLKACGKYFMYHNHAREFRKENGKLILEQLIERIPADEMGFILDTYWVQRGGGDPAQWLEKMAGRIPCIHLKDYAYDQVMAPVGEGNINFEAVIQAAADAGTEYLLVEQDDCHGEDPFDCLARSYQNLRALGLD